MRQHIVPVSECRGRDRIGRGFEGTKSSTHQIGSRGGNGQNQKDGRKQEFLEFGHGQSLLGRGGNPPQLTETETE